MLHSFVCPTEHHYASIAMSLATSTRLVYSWADVVQQWRRSAFSHQLNLGHAMQVIRQYFQLASVLEVAHRLGSITDCDRVAVMEAGNVVEMGSPAQLIQDPESLFCRMAQQQARHH